MSGSLFSSNPLPDQSRQPTADRQRKELEGSTVSEPLPPRKQINKHLDEFG